jgi:hypothetical protein
MAACQTVSKWMTQNVLVPVTQVLTEAQEKCDEVREWVEEQVEQPVAQQVSQAQEQCKNWPWPLNWVCSVVTVIVTIIVWVVVTVGKWVTTIVCQVVTVVIGTIVTLVLQLVSWLVTFVVCLFTDPLAALVSIRDLWSIGVDALGHLFDFVDMILADVDGILGDVEDLIDSVAAGLGWLGVILGLLKGLIHLIRDVISGVRDFLGGVKDLVLGILSGNLCRMIRGVLDLAVAGVRVGFATGFGFGPWAAVRAGGSAAGGVRDSVDQHRLEDLIRELIGNAFGTDQARIDRSLKAVQINTWPKGLRFDANALRMFIDSENRGLNAKMLHDAGVIDLRQMAGYVSDCGKLYSVPDTEVVYTGTNVRVSWGDIDAYLAGGPGSVTPFRVYAITRSKFRTHLDCAQRKLHTIGVRLFYDLGEVMATLPTHVPLAADESSDAVQQALFTSIDGRDASGAGLSTIPTISHFHYTLDARGKEGFGLTSWFRPSSNDTRVSGVTYRNLSPDWAFRFVLAHELGHYLGLNHLNRAGADRPLDEIMYSPRNGVKIGVSTFAEYLLLEGEPVFTFDDARTTWEWITGPIVRDILLP